MLWHRSVTSQPQLYTQRKHRRSVIQSAQAQATSYTCSPSTGNQLYKQPKHGQPVIQRAQRMQPATLYTPSLTSECPSPSTGNQLYILPKSMQSVTVYCIYSTVLYLQYIQYIFIRCWGTVKAHNETWGSGGSMLIMIILIICIGSKPRNSVTIG